MNRFRMNLGPAVEPASWPKLTMADVAEASCTTVSPSVASMLSLKTAPELLAKMEEAIRKCTAIGTGVFAGVGRSDIDDREVVRKAYEAIAKDNALDRVRASLEVARSLGINGYQITGTLIGKTAAELDEMDARLAAAIHAHKPLPAVTLKAEPVREVKPYISGLDVVR
jgi:hypothetical protein